MNHILLEIFGYVGMALVLVSMMMTSVKWLRLFNMTGAIICAIYGILTNTWPTALLNMGLLIIQAVQLIRLYRMEKKEVTK
ncbi:MAG: uroporphyrinogen decarboxylase [Ruminococcaceae bacterium]|nr:uroporphyrinogen decarboxylase [Oscillospiraceae bacterium]